MSTYQPINWGESSNTPLDGENLSKMDTGIVDAHNGNNNPLFGNYDVSMEPEEPLFVEQLSKDDIMSVILMKISKMFQNVRYLLNKPYLVERGMENGWTYEKWSDGISKCWGVIDSTTATDKTSNSGDGIKSYFLTTTKPFPSDLFISAPIVMVTANDNGTGIATAENENSSNLLCQITTWGAQGAVGSANVFAMGRWKA